MSIDLPDAWQACTLGKALASAEGGGTPPRDVEEYWNGDIPWASVKDVVKGNGSIPAETITAVGLANSTSRVIAAGTNIFAARMGVGAVTRYPIDVAINQDLMALKPAKCLDADYLYHWLRSKKAAFVAVATGTTVKGIRKDLLLSFPLSLPPLDEQRRIAEVLVSVDEAIAANRAALNQVARVRSAILHAAFEETLWEAVPLGELGSWQSGGTPSKEDDTKWGGNVPWVCPRDMKNPVIRKTHSTLTSLALGGSCKLVPKGTLLIVVRGMILAKAIPTATTAMDATFNQDMKAFRPNGRALPKFVQLCLQHQERRLLGVVNTATHGTKKLDTDTLLAVAVPLPDLKTQRALGDAVSDLDFTLVKYGEEHIRLNTIKQALMHDLLSGYVRVPA